VFDFWVSPSFSERHILRGSESPAPDAKGEIYRAPNGTSATCSFLFQWHRSNGLDCQAAHANPTLKSAPDSSLMMNHDSFHAFPPANRNLNGWAADGSSAISPLGESGLRAL